MKSKNTYITLISLFLVFGLLSLILFLTIPDERLETSVFWIAFSFAIPVNFVSLSAFAVWGFWKKGEGFIKLPIALTVSAAFGILYLLSGILFMYLPAEKTTFPIILYSIITVAFIIAAMLSVNGANYMSATEKVVKEKRLYIKMLEADVLDCLANAEGEAKVLLTKLAEDIRFSDPMSHSALSAIEAELTSLVFAISEALKSGAEDVISLIKKADALLKSRNSRCLMLK